MKAGSKPGVVAALVVGLLLSHQASADCEDGDCTALSVTKCSEDKSNCHTGYFIGYKCPGSVTYEVKIHNGADKEHVLNSWGPNSVQVSKIGRWNLTKDAYVEEVSCCEDSTCTLIADDSLW